MREDFNYDTLYVFPVFQVSQEHVGYLPETSPVTSPEAHSKQSSPLAPAPGYRLNEVTGSFDSMVGSPVTSLSVTDYTAHLAMLSEPLIPLPNELLLLPLPVPMRPIPSPDGQLPVEPIALVGPYPLTLSREGPFVTSCKPGDTGGYPFISARMSLPDDNIP